MSSSPHQLLSPACLPRAAWWRLLGASLLGACLVCGGALPARAQQEVLSRMLIVLDSSGSMTWAPGPGLACQTNDQCESRWCRDFGGGDQRCWPNVTFGDGSDDLPGIDLDGNGRADDSRLHIAKGALRQMLAGTSELEFGLMRFYQLEDFEIWANSYYCYLRYSQVEDPQTQECSHPEIRLNYWGRGYSCVRGGELLVPMSATSHPRILQWIDGHERWDDNPALRDPEIRGDGETPLAASLQQARTIFAGLITDDARRGCRRNSVLLLTDGKDECRGDPVQAAGELRFIEVEGTQYEVKTYVVGFGEDVADAASIGQLNQIAEQGGTNRAFFADNAVSLQVALNDIVQDAIPVETCNGLDDDCDGETDEGLSQACTTLCGQGVRHCSAGQWGACSSPEPSFEVCDGVDNDCDGLTDEDLFPPADFCPAQGVCGGLVAYCDGELGWLCPFPGAHQLVEDRCDNEDNDCDGEVDEDILRTCRNLCGEGQEHCEAGRWVGCDARQPEAEVCDGVDNDCNGLVDDGVSRPCQQGCNEGRELCRGGEWLPCDAPPPGVEVCDNLDNDCDGTVDEDLERDCTTVCGSGVERCVDGLWQDCDAIQPRAEACDLADNDCDGETDEDVLRACYTPCGRGFQRCVDGAFTACDAVQVAAETCDGQDNDCDGFTDEDLVEPCESACGPGFRECRGGIWLPCVAEGAEDEICDGVDNDCDGLTDEDLRRSCANACDASAYQLCEDGFWAGCVSDPPFSAETCDGEDNDCNGAVDDGLLEDCSNDCGAGFVRCEGGAWTTCNAPVPQAEICDSLDNDCDGFIDNDAPCDAGRTCYLGLCVERCRGGECALGFDCEGGFCLPNGCAGFECAAGLTCVATREGPQCVRDEQCAEECPWGTFCDNGSCVPVDCYQEAAPCEEGICRDGTCVPDPCEGVECPAELFCREAACVATCVDVRCPPGQRCTDGECAPDACYGRRCPEGQACFDGECIADPCLGVRCPRGRICELGRCVHDPCLEIQCPGELSCQRGHCDPPLAEPCDGVECPTGTECTGDGHCAAPALPDLGPSEDPDLGPPEADLGYQPPPPPGRGFIGGGGCACHAAGATTTPVATPLGLLLLGLGLLRRRHGGGGQGR